MTSRIPLIFPCVDMVRVCDAVTDTLWEFSPAEAADIVGCCRRAAIRAAVEGSDILLLRSPVHCRALSLVVDAPMCCAIAAAVTEAAAAVMEAAGQPANQRAVAPPAPTRLRRVA